MSSRNTLGSQGGGPAATGWEQQHQQHQQQQHATNNPTSSRGMAGVTAGTGQEVINTFIIERYSRQNPTPSSATNTNNTNNNNVTQTKTSTFGGVSSSPLHPAPRTTSNYAFSSYNNNNFNNNNAAMGIASDTRSWSLTTTASSTATAAGRSLAETKEQSSWIHLSTPIHSLTLTLKFAFRPQTQADLNNCRPFLLIQTGNEILECLGLDRASVRSTKLRGIVKGTMIGFRYTSLSSSSSSSSSSTLSSPGSIVSEQPRKFQIKFKTTSDCSQCTSFLSTWIDCHSVVAVARQGGGSQLSNIGSQVMESSQDTDMTMVPSPSPFLLSPPLPPPPHPSAYQNSSGSGMATNYNPTRYGGVTRAQPGFQHPGTGTDSGMAVGNDELSQMLRSAASTSSSNAFVSAPRQQHQHLLQQERQQQRQSYAVRQEKLVSITPQSESQPTPASRLSATSYNTSPSFPVLNSMPMMAPTGASGGGGDESFEASASPGIQSINSTTHSVNTNIDNTSSTASTTTTSTATASSNLGSILNASDAEIQEKINAVLHDPKFPAVLLRMDQLLRGCGSKQ